MTLPIDILKNSRSSRIVIAFVGRKGAGVTTTVGLFKDLLEQKFNYLTNKIRISENFITSRADDHEVVDALKKINNPKTKEILTIIGGESIKTALLGYSLTPAQKVHLKQDIGNAIREKDRAALSVETAQSISRVRTTWEHSFDQDIENSRRKAYLTKPHGQRIAFLIDSLKNPAEAELLRLIYGDEFYLINVQASDEARNRRNGADLKSINEIDRDYYEKKDGQNVRETSVLADVFFRNDTVEDLKKAVSRYLNIIFNIGIESPTHEEAGMHAAASAAVRSACLSRQVGAAITSSAHQLLSVGWNDVPKAGGGVYTGDDSTNDCRCFKDGGYCRNTKQQKLLLDQLQPSGKSDRIRDLLEFSRAVHAEMAAITAVGRGQTGELENSMMYVTTYPCHICARHIVAAGIQRVVYIEPYPKSMAGELHGDSIGPPPKVTFAPYNGIAPGNWTRYFKKSEERKDEETGVFRLISSQEAIPKVAPLVSHAREAELFPFTKARVP
jgi:deoxycytidylate deaminase